MTDPYNMSSARDRLRTDGKFALVVNSMVSMLEAAQLNVVDLATAVTLAAQIHAERHSSPLILTLSHSKTDGEKS